MALLGASAGSTGAAPLAPARPRAAASDWRSIATHPDRARLRGWRTAWFRALEEARAAEPAEIAADPLLFDPDRALANPMPPPGDYRCRTIKLGKRGGTGLSYIAYPAFACRISARGDRLGFEKRTGSQRPIGIIYPDRESRAIFLGTLVLGDETRALDYGRDDQRDLIATVERIDAARWRMAFPLPAYESLLDVIELVPAD